MHLLLICCVSAKRTLCTEVKYAEIRTCTSGETLIQPRVRVKLSLRLTNHHATGIYGGSGGIAPCIFKLDAGWKRTPHPLNRRLDPVAKRKIFIPCRELNPGRPARNQALYRLSYPRLPSTKRKFYIL
jgi:hypothetical protein